MINPKPLKNDKNVLTRKVGISAFLSFFIKIKNGSKEPKIFSFVRKFSSASYPTKKASAKNFSRSDCVEITDINMLKRHDRIGCNDSPYSLVNQQTESMTEKFFKESFSPLL